MIDQEDEIDVAPMDDIAADIRSAAEQASSKSLGDKLTQDSSPPEDKPEASTDTRPRDASGKFLPKDTSVEAKPAPEQTITDADRLSEQQVQPSNAVQPPTSWSADAKAHWATLPPALQQAVAKREQEMAEGQRQWSERENAYRQAITPASMLSQQYQMPEGEVIKRLVDAERRLQQDAPNAIAELAQAYGVDLAALVNGSPQPQRQAPAFDPSVIPQLVERQVTEKLTAYQQDQALNSEITAFASERGPDGQLKYPHFEAVKPMMGLLLQSEKAQNLADAYQKAIWLDPGTRPQAQAPVADQVARAKRAAVSPKGAPNSTVKKGNGFDPKQSLDDDLREAMSMYRN